MKSLLVIFIFLLSAHQGIATSYYFSNNGNDTNDGKSGATPWCSLLKLSETQHLFKSGDSLLFERGSVFSGQISIITSGIYLGTYGVGPKPVISGSTEVPNWIVHGKNIWKAECLNCVEPANLFVNGVAQPTGRYPNTGYLTISGTSQADTSITDMSMLFNDAYWNGAEIVVRSNRWTIDKLPVREYEHKTFKTSLASSYPLEPGSGYFLQKHLSTLDQPGEWFYQPSTKQIYLFLESGVNPMSESIRVSVLDFGLSVSAPDVVIENLVFEHQRLAGVSIKNSDNVSLQHIEIQSSGRNGLEVTNCENPCVENSLIANSNNNGVEWHNNTGGKLSYNTITRTGMNPGMGASGDGSYIALRITADKPHEGSNLIEHNTIDSTGYIGIDFRTGNTSIKKNTISNFCLIKDDGGGIYTWENTLGNNTIKGNIISNGIGAGEGTINPTQLFAHGIYIDDRSSHVLVKSNEVSNCATSGIFLHNAKVITIVNNRLFKNGNSLSNKEKGQLFIKLDTLGQFAGNYDLQVDVILNKMVAVSDASYCVYLSADKKQHLQNLGKFTQNEFSAGRAQQAVAELHHDEGLCLAPDEFSVMDWQRKSGNEKGSVFKPLFRTESFEVNSKNLISNGGITSGTKGWMVWPEKISIVAEKKDDAESHSLKVNFPKGSTEALLYHQDFSLRKGALYRLSFSARSLQEGKLEFVPLMANSPWQALGAYTCFSIGATNKTFIYYFQADQDNAKARINFKSNATFWIDNVSLYEIIGTSVDIAGQSY